MMTSVHTWATANAPKPVFPREVGFHYSRPDDISAHLDAFAPIDVTFGTDVSYLIFDNAQLDQPVIGANRALFRDFEDRVERAVGRLDSWDSWTERTRKMIANKLRGDTPTIDGVAADLNASVRTLQLRLSQEGTSFSQVLSDTKSDLAKEFLKSGDVRTDEIAYLLGYSEESAFARSFKRWTGRTPSQFKASLHA
jgi:AraC-like DNA-binding protein